MIRFSKESPVVCDTCKQPAIRRELPVEGRITTFDTHNLSITDREWFAAIRRMEKFLGKAVALERELNKLGPLALERGQILRFEVGTIRPDACSRRCEAFVICRVKAFAQEADAKTEPIKITRVQFEAVLKKIRAAAGHEVARLKAKFDQGNF